MEIRLMADYECYPLWEILPDGVRNIAPEELPLTDRLKHELRDWAARYDATLLPGDPASSGFRTTQEEQGFENEGMRLWASLRTEIGSGIVVVYFSQKQHRELRA
ncbi:MAG: hypothetical protein WCN95_05790 [bacterium]